MKGGWPGGAGHPRWSKAQVSVKRLGSRRLFLLDTDIIDVVGMEAGFGSRLGGDDHTGIVDLADIVRFGSRLIVECR